MGESLCLNQRENTLWWDDSHHMLKSIECFSHEAVLPSSSPLAGSLPALYINNSCVCGVYTVVKSYQRCFLIASDLLSHTVQPP